MTSPRPRKAVGAALLVTLLLLAACTAPIRMSLPGDRAYEVDAAYVGATPAVAWYGGRLAHEAIFLRHADASGRPDGPVLQLTDATRDAYEPSLQGIGEGDVLLAWYEQVRTATELREQVALIARFDAQGKPRWQHQLSTPGARGRIPVARVRGNEIHVAWLEQQGEGTPIVRAATLDGDGNWIHAPGDAAMAGRTTWNLGAAVGEDGTFHIVYDRTGGTRASELYWVQVRNGHITQRAVSHDDGYGSTYPDIALQGSRAALSWTDIRDGNEQTYLRCIMLDGAGAPAPGLVLDDEMALRVTRRSQPSIGAYLAWHQGQLMLTWTGGRSTRRRLWLQRFDTDCHPLGRARALSPPGSNAGIASPTASPAGFAVAWNSQLGPDAPEEAQGPTDPVASVALLWTRPVPQPGSGGASRGGQASPHTP